MYYGCFYIIWVLKLEWDEYLCFLIGFGIDVNIVRGEVLSDQDSVVEIV